MPVKSLSKICEIQLGMNYHLIQDIGDVRFQLIKPILLKFNATQLINLEQKNPKLVLEDDYIWLKIIQKQFPNNLDVRFTHSKDKILNFYKNELSKLNFDASSINFDNYLVLDEAAAENSVRRYKLPSKLLYLKYSKELSEKEELAIFNLRERMKKLRQEKEQNKVIKLDRIIPITNNGYRIKKMKNSTNNERSKLFMKSKREADLHKSFFKNPRKTDLRVIHPPQRSVFNSSSCTSSNGTGGSESNKNKGILVQRTLKSSFSKR